MEQIIVTVCDRPSGYRQDMEIPTGVPAKQLLDDITQALMGYEPSLRWDLSQIALSVPRLGLLEESETALEAGVRNGEYLYIVAQ